MASTIVKTPKATVFIPTYNGDQYLEDLLKAVFKQSFPFNYEVLVIDSGSTDKTLDIINKFPKVKLHQIPNSEFGHGKTRNLAAKMSNSEFMVYLSQDAIPANNRWLEYMIEPFLINDKVYCVYGKQIPRAFSDATTKREVSSVFKSLGPDHSIMIDRKNSMVTDKKTEAYLTFFSDVNSAVKRESLLNQISYRDVRYSEDQFMGRDVLEAGLLKAYTPLGAVVHSNEYSIKDYFYRKFDENLGIYESLGILPPSSIRFHIKKTIMDIIRDFIFIIRDKDFSIFQKARNFPSSVIRNIQKQRAAYLVANHKLRKKHGTTLSLENRKKS